MADRYDVAVVGGGIVGLATAWALAERAPRAQLALLEKEARLATHQTGHNSGVIHSGIYYRPGSHKARLCVAGARLMVEFAASHGIPVGRCGKVIVATTKAELPRLQALFERGQASGVPRLALLDPARVREIEPHAAALRAIHSPSTAIIDYGEVAAALARDLTARGVAILARAELRAARRTGEGLVLITPTAEVRARHLVNCAGLYADVVARRTGAAPDVRIVPFRGEYYTLWCGPSGETWCAGSSTRCPTRSSRSWASTSLGRSTARSRRGPTRSSPSHAKATASDGSAPPSWPGRSPTGASGR